MSDYSRFNRWNYSARDVAGYGSTPGDTVWLGYRNVESLYPCPNGLGFDSEPPNENEHWRARVEKAKRDIEWHRREFEAADLVFSESDVLDLISIARELDE